MSNLRKNQIPTTLQSLKEEFGNKTFVRLDEIAGIYLDINSTTAKRRAGEGALPFHASRFGNSQKSPYLVRLTILAQYIDDRCKADFGEWKKAKCRH